MKTIPFSGQPTGIRERHCLGHQSCQQGHGTKFVKAFTDWLLEQPDIPAVMTDPDIANYAAIRCYQKAGFQKIKEMETVEGSIILMERRR